MELNKTADWLLRIGVGFAFLYPPISALVEPFAWVGYFPLFVTNLFPYPILLLHIFGVIEVTIGLWILSGKKIVAPSILAAVMLAGIIVFNFSQIDVLFRDIPILLMAVVLAITHKESAGTLIQKEADI